MQNSKPGEHERGVAASPSKATEEHFALLIGQLGGVEGGKGIATARDALIAIGHDAVPPLLKALQCGCPRTRMNACMALGAIAPACEAVVDALLAALRDSGDRVSRSAAEVLVKSASSGSVKAVKGLLDALLDRRAEVCWMAMGALQEIDPAAPAEVIGVLLAELRRGHPHSQIAAARALRAIAPSGEVVVEGLVAALRNRISDVRADAAEALGRVTPGGEVAAAALLVALEDEDGEVRAKAAVALGARAPGSADVVDALLAALRDECPRVRRAAAEALGKGAPGGEDVAAALLAAMHDLDAEVRAAAAEAMGKGAPGGEQATDSLLAALQDEAWQVRASAAIALGETAPGRADIVDALLAALLDVHTYVRWGAATALGKIAPGEEVVAGSLLAALRDEDIRVREAAAEALLKTSPGGGKAVDALLAAVRGEDAHMHSGAMQALGKLAVVATENRAREQASLHGKASADTPLLIDAPVGELSGQRRWQLFAHSHYLHTAHLTRLVFNDDTDRAIPAWKIAERLEEEFGREIIKETLLNHLEKVEGLFQKQHGQDFLLFVKLQKAGVELAQVTGEGGHVENRVDAWKIIDWVGNLMQGLVRRERGS